MKSSGDLVQQRIDCCVAQHRVIPVTSLSVLSDCRAWISHPKRWSRIAMQCSKKWGLLAWCSRVRDLQCIITCPPGRVPSLRYPSLVANDRRKWLIDRTKQKKMDVVHGMTPVAAYEFICNLQ